MLPALPLCIIPKAMLALLCLSPLGTLIKSCSLLRCSYYSQAVLADWAHLLNHAPYSYAPIIPKAVLAYWAHWLNHAPYSYATIIPKAVCWILGTLIKSCSLLWCSYYSKAVLAYSTPHPSNIVCYTSLINHLRPEEIPTGQTFASKDFYKISWFNVF